MVDVLNLRGMHLGQLGSMKILIILDNTVYTYEQERHPPIGIHTIEGFLHDMTKHVGEVGNTPHSIWATNATFVKGYLSSS